MKVRLWGVRGSTPTPERGNERYGGNTSCVEVRLDNNTLIILDCGTGLRALGKSLLSEFAGRTIQAISFSPISTGIIFRGFHRLFPFTRRTTPSFFTLRCAEPLSCGERSKG